MDPSSVFTTRRGPRDFQMASKMEPILEQMEPIIDWEIDTDLFNLGIRTLLIVEDQTETKWKTIGSKYNITCKRLNMLKAQTTIGFSMILVVRVFDCSMNKSLNKK